MTSGAIELINDTRLNVASLLQEPIGSVRDVQIHLDAFRLDDDLIARDVSGTAHLTRLGAAILVAARLKAVVPVECVRCLRVFDQPVTANFTEQFRQSVDVLSGQAIDDDELTTEEDAELEFVIDENHELDLDEAIRQWIVLSLPMRQVCEDCPGPPAEGQGGAHEVDERFAGLANLLDSDDDDGGGNPR
jgi:uncharacterized protein